MGDWQTMTGNVCIHVKALTCSLGLVDRLAGAIASPYP